MQAQLKRTEIAVQQMIEDREKKVGEIKHSVELNKVRERRSAAGTSGLAAVSLTLPWVC